MLLMFYRNAHEKSERDLREQVKMYQNKSRELEVFIILYITLFLYIKKYYSFYLSFLY